jgi:hypothetical protein
MPILPGLYRAGSRTIKVLHARGGMVRYWDVPDRDSPDDPAGKTLATMTAGAFAAAGFAAAGPTNTNPTPGE